MFNTEKKKSAQVPKCLIAMRVRVPKYLKCSSARMPSEFLSDQVPSECPSALSVSSECLKCSSALWMSLNARPVPEYLIRCDLNEILNIKRCFMYIQKEKEMVEKNLKSLILKQYQSADLKSFWNWFEIFCKKDFCKNSAFCVGSINDLPTEQKTFLWNVF